MRLQEHANTLETNVEVESQNFGIGDASVVIEILRNRLYEHKIRTLVQEYICNARDAMREVGKGNEFEVTVPNDLNPVFKVRDFGPGISPDRMRDVFVMYGASTKRNTNSQTGGFGIGAKSAWSYTDSFTIVSTVDGVRRTYVAHTGVNNNGRLDLISTEQSDESNGTEIQVAVKPHDVREFRKAVFRAIYFWEQKPTLRGELDPPTLVSGTKVSSAVEVIYGDMLPEYIEFSRWSDRGLAVIDGVPYKITEAIANKIKHFNELRQLLAGNIILHFGNGIVEVGASRESIADSPTTIKGLEGLVLEACHEIKNYIKEAFKDIKTPENWIETYTEMSKVFRVDQYAKFDKYSIDRSIIHSDLFKRVNMTIIHCMSKRGAHKVEKITKESFRESQKVIELSRLGHVFFYTKQESPVIQNKRAREYFKNNTHMLIIEPMDIVEYETVKDKDGKESKIEKSRAPDMAAYNKILKDFKAKDFSSVVYVDPPKVKKEKVKREDAEICLHTVRSHRHTYTTLASNSQKWFYVPIVKGAWQCDYDTKQLRSLEDYLTEHEDARICGIAERGLKMVKGDENFLPLDEWIKEFTPCKQGIKYAKSMLAQNGNAVVILGKGSKLIKDEFLNEMLEEYDNIRLGKQVHIPEILLKGVNELDEVKEFKKKDAEFTKLMKNQYPLVNSLSTWTDHKEEVAHYINGKYAAVKKGK